MPQDEKNKSLWQKSVLVDCPNLLLDQKTDVCVIGAGIAGLSTAYELLLRGYSVVVVDRDFQQGGQTFRTTAHLSNACDDRYYEMERIHGAEKARLIAESHSVAIEHVESIVRSAKIDCDFSRLPGYLFLAPDDPLDLLDKELKAARSAGLSDVEIVCAAPHGLGPCLKYPLQAQFHPRKYLNHLTNLIIARGGKVFTGAHVMEVNSLSSTSAEVITREGQCIYSRSVVVATNTPINDRIKIQTKLSAHRTYAVGFEIPRGSLSPGLYWDTADPYHYIRAASDDNNDVLIVGGEDHRTGQPNRGPSPFARIEHWARLYFPFVRQVAHIWSGQVLETLDGVAYIGRNPMDGDNIYIHTGDSGQGITHGVIGALLLADLISGLKNPWAELYDPSRKTLKSAQHYVTENLNTIYQYRRWLTRGDADSRQEIPTNSGAVMRCGLRLVADFRDSTGAIHETSAICPHLGGIVTWNAEEQTWDCPAHGSRFNKDGKVICGPAVSDLHQRAA